MHFSAEYWRIDNIFANVLLPAGFFLQSWYQLFVVSCMRSALLLRYCFLLQVLNCFVDSDRGNCLTACRCEHCFVVLVVCAILYPLVIPISYQEGPK